MHKKTLVAWLKSNLSLKIECLETHIYMKTECLQTKWDAASFRAEGKRVGILKRGKLKQVSEVRHWLNLKDRADNVLNLKAFLMFFWCAVVG